MVKRNKIFAAERKKIAGVAGAALPQAMSALSDSLRTLMRAASGARPAELDAFLSECDAVAYAPTSSGEAVVSSEVIERALALALAIEEGAS